MLTRLGESSVSRQGWREFLAALDWRQGEHVMFIGPTGRGKTTMAKELLQERERRGGHIVNIVTKPRDDVWTEMQARGYEIIRSWKPKRGQDRLILWPKFTAPEDAISQRSTINDALGRIFAQGGWTVYVDELDWLTNGLGLKKWPKTLWQQGRSLKLTFVSGVQRPRNVPLDGYANSTHLFIWGANDREDIKRLSGLGEANALEIRKVVSSELGTYDVLYVNTRSGETAITKVER